MNTENTAIKVHHLTHQYGKSTVLNDISFAVHLGDFFIIIGPNGSGKTTLLKILANILVQHKGDIEILSKALNQYSRKALARTIAYVPQSFPSDFPFSALEIVLMGRAPHLGFLGVEEKKDYDIAFEAMRFTGVDHLAHRKLEQLSGGEKQRIFVARAICQEPQIMLLDEPTASLDLTHQIRLMDLMERLKQDKHVTVVMVSHDVNLAAMYGDALLLIKEGKIENLGRPGDVLTFETLERVYGCPVLVNESPLGKIPQVTPVPGKFIPSSTKKRPNR